MFAFRAMNPRFPILFVALSATSLAYGQFAWQRAEERDPAEVERIVGEIGKLEPSRDLNIVWVWGIDKMHGKGYHEYAWVMDRYVNDLLCTVPRVTVTPAMHFPSDEQWEKADLVVFYLHVNETRKNDPWDYDAIDRYQKRGGGLIFLHFALAEGSGVELAKRVGQSMIRTSKWGIMYSPVSLTAAAANSPIFEGFPAQFELPEEHYWALSGDVTAITPLVTSPAGPAIENKGSDGPPKLEDLDGKPWPVMWTKEVGKGKVFATVAGHNFFTYNDPYFRIILLRAMAWTMNESFDPFKPLVTMRTGR